MSQSKRNSNSPSFMLIMRSVAQAAGMTTADLVDGSRRAGLCHARAAVYKIASQNGYSKDEIMYFLDRNRTVAYNYEANLSGYLLRNAEFNTLCDNATKILNGYPHRVERKPQPSNEDELIEAIPPQPTEPVLTDWKGKLGWTFTAEECRREWYAKRAAAEYMKHYGQVRQIKHTSTTPQRRVPAEMTTGDAAAYLNVSPGVLVKGVQLGRLQRFKKPRDTSYWYHTDELDKYKTYLEHIKR